MARMDRTQKAEVVESLNGLFGDAGSVVVAHYSGMTVAQMGELRSRMRAAGCLVQSGQEPACRARTPGNGRRRHRPSLQRPDGNCDFSKDPVAASKVAVAYAKENEKLVILGGMVGGTAIDASGVKALAELPSLDALRGKIVGLLKAPATKLAGLLAGARRTACPRHRRIFPEGCRIKRPNHNQSFKPVRT